MALRTLQAVVATNYSKLSTDPILAGDIVAFNAGNTNAPGVNPAPVARATTKASNTTGPITIANRGQVLGVAADDALGTNPAGETPTMINNDPAGSNFVNGSTFQSYTAGFYVGAKRAIADLKDESVDVVTNLTAGIPTYSSRGVTVYTTPSTQFVSDRFALLSTNVTLGSADTSTWYNITTAQVAAPQAGDLLTVGCNNATNNSYASSPSAPTATGATVSTNNAGLLVSACSSAATLGTGVVIVGRVDFYDSGAGLLYWTLL
jgi:hypothetical protein